MSNYRVNASSVPAHRLGCILACGVVSLLLALHPQGEANAAAQPVVFLWGFQRGCERHSRLDEQVQQRLGRQGVNVQRLTAGDSTLLPACPWDAGLLGTRCGQAMRAQCPAASGLLLGGLIVSGPRKQATQVRLWLHDLQGGQTWYQDDYCDACDPDLSKVVTSHVTALLSRSRTGPRTLPNQLPSYCPVIQAQPSVPPRPRALVYLQVAQVGSYRLALQGELLTQLGVLGNSPQLVPPELGHPAPENLERLTQGHPGSQILFVKTEDEDGALRLTLWDGDSHRSAQQIVRCTDCGKGGFGDIKQAVPELLERCFADRCADQQVNRPLAACEPFPTEACPLHPLLLVTRDPRPPIQVITPAMRGQLHGLSWGLVGVTLCATVAVSLVNELTDVTAISGARHTSRDVGLWLGGGTLFTAAMAAGISSVTEKAWARQQQRQRATDPGSADPILANHVLCPR